MENYRGDAIIPVLYTTYYHTFPFSETNNTIFSKRKKKKKDVFYLAANLFINISILASFQYPYPG